MGLEKIGEEEGKRCKKLRANEWQRWTPVVGFYRLIKDELNGDRERLDDMYPEQYNNFLNAYNLIQGCFITATVSSLPIIVEHYLK